MIPTVCIVAFFCKPTVLRGVNLYKTGKQIVICFCDMTIEYSFILCIFLQISIDFTQSSIVIN